MSSREHQRTTNSERIATKGRRQQTLWFVGLYLGGVLAVTLLSYGLRFLMTG